MKRLVLDTNVYGWHIAYAARGSRQEEAVNSFALVSKLQQAKDAEVFATDTIEREIKDAKFPTLSELFHSLVKGVIKKTRQVEELANEYYQLCKNNRLHFVTVEDCEIIAATAIAGVGFLVTENRKTLNNPKVVEIINKVNLSKKLKSPKILNSKNALGEIFV